MSTYFDPGNGNFVIVDGNIVERDAHNIAVKIKEYDEDLELICLDPDSPDITFASAPFLVIKRTADGSYERVLEAWQLDDRIIERIWAADSQKNNVLDTLVKMEEKQRKEREDANKQQMFENHELFAAAMQNPKSSFTFKNDEGDMVKISDEEGVVKNNNRKSFN